MIYRTLGSTGEKVSAIGVGGWHLALKHVDDPTAFRIVRSALDRGINDSTAKNPQWLGEEPQKVQQLMPA